MRNHFLFPFLGANRIKLNRADKASKVRGIILIRNSNLDRAAHVYFLERNVGIVRIVFKVGNALLSDTVTPESLSVIDIHLFNAAKENLP